MGNLVPDHRIKRLVKLGKLQIEPFSPKLITSINDGLGEQEVVSFGLSSFGYDFRLANRLKIFYRKFDPLYHMYEMRGKRGIEKRVREQYIDPKKMSDDVFFSIQYDSGSGDPLIIPPNSYALGVTIEYIKLPKNITAFTYGKSTYSRAGLSLQPAVIEAGWKGHLTIELANNTPLPIIVYPEEGICQACFFESDDPCKVSYEDRKGKYQNQPPRPMPPKKMRRR